jgi:hypothetical protein
MSTVNTYIGKKDKPGHVGLELEVEAKHELPSATPRCWLAKPEGSLRGHAMEYVTDGPIKCDLDKFGKIKALTDLINDNKYQVDKESPRTSLHVHVNVGQLTPVQMWTSATAYWLCERLLMKYCGADMREGNLFCLRLADADGVIKVSCKDLKGKQPFRSINTDKIRYSSQNLNAVPKFGSIEYRGMRGVTDPVIIDTWSDELYKMVTSAKKYSDPADLLDKFANLDKKDFLKSLFTNSFVDTLTQVPNWRQLMDADVGRLVELGYFHDWNEWSTKIEKNRLNNKINDKVSSGDLPIDAVLSANQVHKAYQQGIPLVMLPSGKFYIPGTYIDGQLCINYASTQRASHTSIFGYLASYGLVGSGAASVVNSVNLNPGGTNVFTSTAIPFPDTFDDIEV